VRVRSLVAAAVALMWWAEPTLHAQIVFRDVTGEAGLKKFVDGALHHGLAWGDVDGDGRLDLFLGNFSDRGANPKYGLTESIPNGVFRQVEEGKFVVMDQPAVARPGRTSGAVLADLDNDGDLDLYVSNNTHVKAGAKPGQNEPSALYRNDAGKFVDLSKESGAVPEDARFGRDVIATDYDLDGLLDLLILEDRVFRQVGRSKLLRNLGGMKFQDVTAKAGLPVDLDAFGAAVADLNEDGRPDLFFTSCNRLFLSGGDGRYREAASLREILAFKGADAEDYTSSAMFGDIDRDGDMDLIVGMHHVPSRVRAFLNDGLDEGGVPKLRDVTKELGIPVLPNKAASCDVADLDNDGHVDLYWSVWFVDGEGRRPFVCRGLGVKDGLPRFEVPSVEGVPLNKRNVVAAGAMVYYVNGPAVDYDADGRLDFFAGIWPDENSRLFRNETAGGNWVEVKLVGDGKAINTMGIGAKVRVLSGRKPLGYREITLCGGYSGTRAAMAHFGLGELKRVDVEVRVPGTEGAIVLKDVEAGRLVSVPVK
jgi:hypothetical protein